MHNSEYLVYDATRALCNSQACCEMVDSSSFMHAKEPKAHQVATLHLKNDTCQQKKSDFQKYKKQKRKMQSIVNIQIHTHQTKTSRLAVDYWLAPGLVLKLCQYYQVGMVLT